MSNNSNQKDNERSKLRPVELRILKLESTVSYEFRSIRAAYKFVEGCIDFSHSSTYLLLSRVVINNKVTEEWKLIGANAERHQQYLVRFKPLPQQEVNNLGAKPCHLHPHMEEIKWWLDFQNVQYKENNGQLSIWLDRQKTRQAVVEHHCESDALIFLLPHKPDFILTVNCKGQRADRLLQFDKEIQKLESS